MPSPKYRSGGSLKKFGTDVMGISGYVFRLGLGLRQQRVRTEQDDEQRPCQTSLHVKPPPERKNDAWELGAIYNCGRDSSTAEGVSATRAAQHEMS